MKIDHTKIRDLQSIIDYFLTGIRDAIMMGGDIRDNVNDQIDECRRQMNEWNAINVMPAEKELVPDISHDFLKQAEKAIYKSPEDINSADNRCIFMSKVYSYIKRTIREKNDMPGPGADRHEVWCYVDCVLADMPNFRDHEKLWYHSMITVADVITTEIMDQRNENPQLDIFTT